jgi:nucleotide-binding universal stress UspA family protein
MWTCPPETVLVATDFGDASARALALGAMVASAYGATLRVVHAERFEPPPYFTIDQIARLEAERRASQAAAVAHLREVAAGVTDYPVDAVIADAPPVDAILHAAASADLIVAGTHGRRGPGRWWLGSVAERVVRAATVPVLVARADMGPARGVFDRIALVGGPAGAARDYAARLAATFGSVVVEAGPLTLCGDTSLREASLVIVATGDAASMTAVAAAGLLSACRRPILFVPDNNGEPRRTV